MNSFDRNYEGMGFSSRDSDYYEDMDLGELSYTQAVEEG